MDNYSWLGSLKYWNINIHIKFTDYHTRIKTIVGITYHQHTETVEMCGRPTSQVPGLLYGLQKVFAARTHTFLDSRPPAAESRSPPGSVNTCAARGTFFFTLWRKPACEYSSREGDSQPTCILRCSAVGGPHGSKRRNRHKAQCKKGKVKHSYN